MSCLAWKNQRPLIILIAVLVFIMILFSIFIDNKIKKENGAYLKNLPPAEETIRRSGNTSRVTFFHSLPAIGSLAIPEEWEGKYRTKEEGNIVTFYYIGEPEKISPIFLVEIYSEQEWKDLKYKNKEIIKFLNNKVYVYSLNIDNPHTGRKAEEFQEMQKEVRKIIESFKVFSL